MAGGPIRSSGAPNHTSGRRTPSARPPAPALPAASPALQPPGAVPARADPHEGPPPPGGQPRGAGAAEGAPRHEARGDRRGRVDRHAEGEAEQPDPEDLIDQRADTGAEEQDRKRREHPAEYNRRH